MPALRHGSDPFEALRFEALFTDIRSRALEERYFEQLIDEQLLDNPATVEIILRPDPQQLARTAAEEHQRLAAYENSLDGHERDQLIVRTRELITLQNTPNPPEVLHLLPQLKPADLPMRPRFHQAQPSQLGDRLFLVNELPTNSICYIDFGFDSRALSADLLPWLSLFGTIVTEIGTADKDYMQFARELGLYTGGFTSSFNTYPHLERSESCLPLLWLHLKALSSLIPRALELTGEVFGGVSFTDRRRIREIVQREYAWAEHSVQSEGYSLASSRVFSHLSPSGSFNEYVNGLTAYQNLKDLALNYDAKEDIFLRALEDIRGRLLSRKALTVSVTGDDQALSLFLTHVASAIDQLADVSHAPQQPSFASSDRAQGLCTAADVVFNVQGCNLFPGRDGYNGHFEVLKTWISRDYLWNTVRQMGGAYGCFVQFNQVTGNFGLVSYRDPHVRRTYSAYSELQSQIETLAVSGQTLQQLILGTYGALDPHQSPAHRGATARNEYLSGITVDAKQRVIEQVLQTETEDLKSFAPFFDPFTTNPYRASIGSADKIQAAADLFTSVIDI
jgi:Zn-dependent M16 (insulinase) family peptidase